MWEESKTNKKNVNNLGLYNKYRNETNLHFFTTFTASAHSILSEPSSVIAARNCPRLEQEQQENTNYVSHFICQLADDAKLCGHMDKKKYADLFI